MMRLLQDQRQKARTRVASMHLTRRIGLAIGLLAFASGKAAGADRWQLNLVLDGRLVTTPSTISFLEGGLGKTRYGDEPRVVKARVAQAAFLGRLDVRPDLTLRVHANLDVEHNFKRRLDVAEALVRYTPALSDHVGLDLRGGLFFPTISLENTDPAWLSPYTTTFSAINSWIGEEVRNLGVEAGPVVRLGGEAHLRLFGALTTRNDPNGTLLAWRGFALHDRVSGYADRIPLPPLKSFARPDLFPGQPRYVQPLREVDSRWSWSTGVSLTHPKYRVKALYQPQTANPAVFDGQQYAWRTGYLALGAARVFGPIELIAQTLSGETRMGLAPGNRNAVVVRFEAAYGLATWSSPGARHRTTLRYDAFRTRDRDDFILQDPNDETGDAWTFAYAFAPGARHRITTEFLRVDSKRTNRRDLGLDPRSIEFLGTLSWRVSF